jgi:hypothetical protein
MIQSIINYVKPYTQLGSIVGKLSAIGVMGYGIRQLWTKESAEKESFASKATLSSLYLLHMGSVSLTVAVLLGGFEISAQVATAIVSTTALIKGSAELFKEYLDNSVLKKQHTNLQKQLACKNIDFQRVLAIFEDFKESETEIMLLEEERAEIKKQYVKRGPNRQNDLNEKWLFLKNAILEKRNKNKVISAFFENINVDNFDVIAALREINEKIAHLRHSQPLTNEHKNKLTDLAILNHQCLKFKKIKETITKLEQLKREETGSSKLDNEYIDIIIKELKKKLNDWKLTKDEHDYVSESEINDADIESLLKPSESKTIFLKRHYTNFIKDLDNKIDNLRFKFKDKQEQYQQINRHPIDDVDFASMFNDMKAIIDLQNQISLAEFNESCKQKNVNFGMVSSVVALLMCAIPGGEFAKFLNPLMLTVGLAGGASSSLDFFNKYLLKVKLLNAEEKKLKRFIQENSFHTIATITNTELRERLVEKLHAILDSKDEIDQKQALKPTRVAKEKAKVLINSKQKSSAKRKLLDLCREFPCSPPKTKNKIFL